MLDRLGNVLVERCGVAAGDSLVVACSGGADSVALTLMLVQLQDRFPLQLHVAHLDHALRPDSGADAAFVTRLTRRLNLPLYHERIDVTAQRRRGENVEAAARRVRRAFLCRVAERVGARHIALGHHLRDQAETVLFRLVRGAGTAGLSGMAWSDPPFVRPLLAMHPERLRRWLRQQGQNWCEDPSNADTRLSRNRLRHDVLPLLETVNARAMEHLVAFAGRMRQDDDWWRQQVAQQLAGRVRRLQGMMEVDLDAIRPCHPALRRRIWLHLLRLTAGFQVDIGTVHLEACDRLLEGAPQADCHLPGVWVGRRYETVLLASAPPAAAVDFELVLDGPGCYRLPDGALLQVAIAEDAGDSAPFEAVFDLDSIAFPLLVRNRRPGDRFRPLGAPGERKLKDVLIDARIPREKRDRLPLLVCGDSILWVGGFRRSSLALPVAGQRVLKVGLRPPDGPETA
ncbi:MAG: tRNA lysidine(34) synthetase TilS [Deltaproteobacteria bacterium]|nr:MAG: tRNA lysidine(34) synthetase TilS [Deltaproteobacteria bacterium]